MGRIIDLRDPDTYISFSDYEACIRRARERNAKVREDFKTEINKKLSDLNLEIDFDSKLINDRTYTYVYLITDGNRVKLGCCYESDGDRIDRKTKEFLMDYFDKCLNKVLPL